MEDPRLSRMYLALFTRRISAIWRRGFLWATTHFGLVTMAGLVLLCGGLVVGWRAHERGRFAILKSQLKEGRPYQEPKSPQPGGQDALVLERTQISGGTMPEFLSATLLPGRGLDLLQITAYLPEKGEVSLLDAPSVAEAARAITEDTEASGGLRHLAAGGALEIPWAGRMVGLRSAEGTSVGVVWRGRPLTLPLAAMIGDGPLAEARGGLLLSEASASSSSNVMPDGGEAQATFMPGNFDRRWPSQTSILATVLLSRTVMEYKVVARNTGTEDEPMGIGWAPRFRIQSGDRSQVLLKLPSSTRIERRSGPEAPPTGKLVPVAGTPYDFTARGGTRLGSAGLEETFVDLHSALFDVGPVVELRDPKSNFGIRVTAMTPVIRAIHIAAAAGSNFVTINEQSNFDDPLGREWATSERPSIVTLHPGESLQWTVRLEIFPLST